ncbi:hypothetical protein [Dyadobacter sediminis]|uniref:Response regulator n=1 Tax=Dyadobacter sediminis TaxID=1493691 RepID=A0A5R9K2V9_9BACT|nr:hypothetical protein [Dyadobacter sediminis]TLU88693.1 hypothetical protein FEM55_24615 [Dyadobacter sediminis]GGC13948.1 hypothetical protein GCM10011325_46110 [Dyadobacter sediminis]
MTDKELILLIDADDDDQQFFQMAVSDLPVPIKFLSFKDCSSAIAYLSSQSDRLPGYIFIDPDFPRIDWEECLGHLKILQGFGNPRIAAYSSRIPLHWQAELEHQGINKLIEKTGTISTLARQIESLLKQDRAYL